MNESERTERDWQRLELAVLGCAINHRPMVAMLTGFMPHEEAFQSGACRALYRAMKEIGLKKGNPEDISVVSVTQAVVELGLLAQFAPAGKDATERNVADAYFEAEAFDPPVPPDALEAACAGLNKRFATAQFARICARYSEQARHPGANAEALVPQMEGDLKALWDLTGTVERRVTTLEAAVFSRLDALDEAYRTQKPAMGLPTGYDAIDAPTGGLHPSTLTILGGWYKDGKTSLAGRIGLVSALTHGKPVLMFSYEMAPDQLADRFFAQWFGAQGTLLQRGALRQVGDVSYTTWSQGLRDKSPALAKGKLGNMKNFLICQSSGMTVQEQEATIRNLNYRLQQEGREPIALVIVDYIQLVRPSRSRKDDRRHEEVSQIGWELAELCRRMAVPVLALSQLSESGHTSESKGLMGHCDSFWTIKRQIQGKEFGMFHMVLNRNAPSNLAQQVQWDEKHLCYRWLDEISDPDGMLQEDKRARAGEKNWIARERNGDRGDMPGKEAFQEVSSHKQIFGAD